MTGRHVLRPQGRGAVQQEAPADLAVAVQAGVGGAALRYSRR